MKGDRLNPLSLLCLEWRESQPESPCKEMAPQPFLPRAFRPPSTRADAPGAVFREEVVSQKLPTHIGRQGVQEGVSS